jgi:hypothetical protein
LASLANPDEAARNRAYQAVNAELVGPYWQLGEFISKKIASAEWGPEADADGGHRRRSWR